MAVNAVPLGCVFSFFVFSILGPFFSSYVIISHNNGVCVKHHTLKSSIRAYYNTDLFPEPGKHKIKHPCKNEHEAQTLNVFCRGIGYYFKKAFGANNVRKKYVGNQKGNEKENTDFQTAFGDFLGIPWGILQGSLLTVVSVNPIFNFSEYHFHKDGLRTYPSTKKAAEYYGKQNDKKDKREHRKDKEVEVLGPEYLAENHEFPINKIKKEKWFATDTNKWPAE
jgi:hypothetical protein